MSDAPKMPESDRLLGFREDAQIIGDFLNWLQTSGKKSGRFRICQEVGEFKEWVQAAPDIEVLLARYFEIDLDVVETEKTALLAHIRAESEEDPVCRCGEPGAYPDPKGVS